MMRNRCKRAQRIACREGRGMDRGVLLLRVAALVHAASRSIAVVHSGRILIKGSTAMVVGVLSVRGLLWTMVVGVRELFGWRWRGVTAMADEGKGSSMGSSMGSSIVLSGGRIHGMKRCGGEGGRKDGEIGNDKRTDKADRKKEAQIKKTERNTRAEVCSVQCAVCSVQCAVCSVKK